MEVFIIRHGGVTIEESGGACGLNVIKASSFETLPSEAANGTIAIITQTNIGTLYVQKTPPATASVGDVYITTSIEQNIAELATVGSLQIGVGYVYMWDGTAWVGHEAYFRSGDAWVDQGAVFNLFNVGSTNDRISGGWSAGEKTGSSVTTVGEEYIELKTVTDGIRTHVATLSSIDLTPYKTLGIEFTCTAVNTSSYTPVLRLGVATSRTANMANTSTKEELQIKKTGEYKMTYNITSQTKAMYIVIGVGYPSATIHINRVWLDKAE